MKIGIVGLGRMGSGMAQRLIRKGHECVVYDAKPAAVTSLQEAGATGAASMQEMVAQMARPRAIWLMIPAAMVDHALNDLVPLLASDDIIIDGGRGNPGAMVRHIEKAVQMLDKKFPCEP